MENELRTLNDIEDIRSGIGFHFTSKAVTSKILENGLLPKLGANSSGGLGKEANDKTFISYGLEGALQLYNRLVIASFQGRLKDFRTNTHESFLPDVTIGRDESSRMSVLEGFEMVRQYMESNNYIVFDCPVIEYDREITEEELKSINSDLKKSKEYKEIMLIDEITELLTDQDKSLEDIKTNVMARIAEYKEKLDKEMDPDKKRKYESKIKMASEVLSNIQGMDENSRNEYLTNASRRRAEYSNTIRNNTLGVVQSKRINEERSVSEDAVIENEEAIIDRVDFNEDKLRWYDQVTNPHNAHTRMINEGDVLKGITIDASRVKVYSVDGVTPATGLEVLEDLCTVVSMQDRLNVKGDPLVLNDFMKYVKMVKKYRMEGLLYTKPAHTIGSGNDIRQFDDRECVDLSDVSKYDGLKNFDEELDKKYGIKDRENEKTNTITQIHLGDFVKLGEKNQIVSKDLVDASMSDRGRDVQEEIQDR